MRYVTIRRASEITGYSEDAIRSKIKRGDWLEEAVWVKAPDGRILIDTTGFEKWVGERGRVFGELRRPA